MHPPSPPLVRYRKMQACQVNQAADMQRRTAEKFLQQFDSSSAKKQTVLWP